MCVWEGVCGMWCVWVGGCGGSVCVCGVGVGGYERRENMRRGRERGRGWRGAKRKFFKQSCIFSYVYVEVDVWSMVQLEQSLNMHNIK